MPNTKFKKYFLILLLLEMFFSYAPVYAQELPQYNYGNAGVGAQIKKYLCAPTEVDPSQTGYLSGTNNYTVGTAGQQQNATAKNKNDGDLYTCINQIYKFAIILAAVVGVFFIVIAGYVYMGAEGNSESVEKAKSILASTVTSLVILFAGYVLLKAINPDLIQFRSIQPGSVVSPTPPGPVTPTPPGPVTPTPPGPVTPTPPGPVTPTPPTPPTGNAPQLAGQILANSQITLAKDHVSTVNDAATAFLNIQDAADGKPASRSNYQGAPGGTVPLNANMLAALVEIGNKYSISVSEIAGGSHTGNSNHYAGNAFDINVVNGTHLENPNEPYVKLLMDECTRLGATEVLNEVASAHHVHCGAFPSSPITTRTDGGPTGAVCQADTSNCSSASIFTSPGNSCNTYYDALKINASKISISGINTLALMESIMVNESSCQVGKVSPSNPPSCGLMQLQPATANSTNYKSACGVTDNIDCAWLTNPANASKSICIAAQYLQFLGAQSSCSGSVVNIAAGYNGGDKACAPSQDCVENSCSGVGKMKAWECLWDNPQHTDANEGYAESRKYAPKVLGCYNTYGG